MKINNSYAIFHKFGIIYLYKIIKLNLNKINFKISDFNFNSIHNELEKDTKEINEEIKENKDSPNIIKDKKIEKDEYDNNIEIYSSDLSSISNSSEGDILDNSLNNEEENESGNFEINPEENIVNINQEYINENQSNNISNNELENFNEIDENNRNEEEEIDLEMFNDYIINENNNNSNNSNYINNSNINSDQRNNQNNNRNNNNNNRNLRIASNKINKNIFLEIIDNKYILKDELIKEQLENNFFIINQYKVKNELILFYKPNIQLELAIREKKELIEKIDEIMLYHYNCPFMKIFYNYNKLELINANLLYL